MFNGGCWRPHPFWNPLNLLSGAINLQFTHTGAETAQQQHPIGLCWTRAGLWFSADTCWLDQVSNLEGLIECDHQVCNKKPLLLAGSEGVHQLRGM